MPCFHPIEAWRGDKNPSGKRKLIFSASRGIGLPIQVPCGQCVGCRLMRAQDWSLRCVHEAQFHEENSFVTLTYSEASLPASRSVEPLHLRDFLRRLRRHLFPKRVRFFACGEYGSQTLRPHYHALLFGHEFFEDRVPYRSTDYGRTYTSVVLDRLWGHGQCEIGSLTSQSAGYVARYSLKKITGDLAAAHYRRVDLATGEVFDVLPEFLAMSKQPGIGYRWFQQYAPDLRDDFAIVLTADGSRRQNIPKYYDKLFDERELAQRKLDRKARARKYRVDQSPTRLAVREECKVSAIKALKRGDPT